MLEVERKIKVLVDSILHEMNEIFLLEVKIKVWIFFNLYIETINTIIDILDVLEIQKVNIEVVHICINGVKDGFILQITKED